MCIEHQHFPIKIQGIGIILLGKIYSQNVLKWVFWLCSCIWQDLWHSNNLWIWWNYINITQNQNLVGEKAKTRDVNFEDERFCIQVKNYLLLFCLLNPVEKQLVRLRIHIQRAYKSQKWYLALRAKLKKFTTKVFGGELQDFTRSHDFNRSFHMNFFSRKSIKWTRWVF